MAPTASTDRQARIRVLFETYIEMYAARDDDLVSHFIDNFTGYAGSSDFLVKDRAQWVTVTRQDFAQVPQRIRIEMLDLALQDLSDDVVVVTAFFHIHLPVPDLIFSRETARLVLIFRLEGADWKITHSGISIPYHQAQPGEVYPLASLQARNSALEAQVVERTEALRQEESRLRSILETALDAVVTTDAQGRVTDWNGRAQAMFGWSKAQALGQPVEDLILPERNRQAHRDGLARFLATGEERLMSRHVEMTAMRRDLVEFPVDMSLSALQQGDSCEFHAFIADISQRRQKEDKLIELRSQLTRSESLYRLLTEDALDVIWRTDRHLRVTYISPADERLRGYCSAEVIGGSVFNMFTPEGALAVKKLWREGRRLPGEGSISEFMNFDVQHRCKDGRVLWGEVLAKPERDQQGEITGYHGITREITQRKQLEDQVRQLAFFDPLTGLPNRRLLTDRLAQGLASSQRSGHRGALIFLDLDNFKTLNDAHGHAMGDLLLMEVAARLRACVRAVDTVSRFGGDEFVVLLGELETDHGRSLAQAHAIAEKIRISLSLPYRLTAATEGSPSPVIEHRCTASIGVMVFAHGTASQEEILKGADAAMYRAKDAGRNTIRFAEPRESAKPTP